MSLTIELCPDVEQRLRVEAARTGQAPEEFVRVAVEERLSAGQRERAQRVAQLMAEWNEEDAADPDPDPVWEIPPISLRVPDVG